MHERVLRRSPSPNGTYRASVRGSVYMNSMHAQARLSYAIPVAVLQLLLLLLLVPLLLP